jgi:hypothetical protein
MKHKFTLLYFLLFAVAAGAQNITGIWKGYFVQSTFGFMEDRYRFEVQVEQLPNHALNGVTYSYKTTVFYGKAEAKGIFTQKTNNIIFNELKLVDLKIADKSEPCLMTCYLQYDKMGEIETLTGTYSSRNLKSGDCGSGKIYLEKSTTSDFYKEEFLIKRENELKKKEKPLTRKPGADSKERLSAGTNKLKPGAESNLIKKAPVQKAPQKATVTAPKKPVLKPKVEDKQEERKPAPAPPTVVIPKKEVPEKLPPPPVLKALPKPDVIKNRNNDLVRTITTSAKDFKIELYDNGDIDGDRISVYHNNELIVSNKMLTDKPIGFTIKADSQSGLHEFVMVAENLGSIPPNTSLMIITAGEKRYELFVTSTEQKNAVVKVEYKPE